MTPNVAQSHSFLRQTSKTWDMFLNIPMRAVTGSMTKHKFLDFTLSLAKILVYIVTFIVVLGCAVLSKGILLFMTSQIADDVTRPFCEGPDGPYDRYEASLQPRQKIAWLWVITFTFFVPQIGTFLRSLRILLFRSWVKPSRYDFFLTFLTESLYTIGLALLVFEVLPNLDVVKGAMLTNAVCLIPAIFKLVSKYKEDNLRQRWFVNENRIKTIVDVLSIVAQALALVIWPILLNVYLIPVSVLLISFGWYENYACKQSVFIKLFPYMDDEPNKKTKSSVQQRSKIYVTYVFVSIWKCALFLAFMFVFPPHGVERYAIFDDFGEVFADHQLNLTSTDYGWTTIDVYGLTPIWIFLINIAACYLCYVFAKFACKIQIHQFSFALPTNAAMPTTVVILIVICAVYLQNPCIFYDHIPNYLFYNVPDYLLNLIVEDHVWIWALWLGSQIWITLHIWLPIEKKFASTEKLFVRPFYDPFLLDQDIALNRRRDDKDEPPQNPDQSQEIQDDDNQTNRANEDTEITIQIIGCEDDRPATAKDKLTRIYVCGTMWRESKSEMTEFLKSIMRLDADQSAEKIHQLMEFQGGNYYKIYPHVFFDDAFNHDSKINPHPQLNDYVKNLIEAVEEAVRDIMKAAYYELPPPKKCCTPYGGRLVWTLPGKNKLTVHLKDNKKIRAKKRWSQVMYMYYIYGHKLMESNRSKSQKEERVQNTYLLALDGDVDFQPEALHLLLEMMRKNKAVGAACGRIHPTGSGPMVWYQMFEYSIGHWLQKATEHEIGCVLCSPGCFSLFRGNALTDVNVMRTYASDSTKALHHVQYDQGEDRWLCTLLLQRGFRVEYSAASDSYTHCPEGFAEFFRQRRRWIPSTVANIFDLLSTAEQTTKNNDYISYLYIFYHYFLMLGTVLGPGMIFLVLVGVCVAVLNFDPWTSLFLNGVPVGTFIIACVFAGDKTQILVAGVLSGMYALVMMAVLIGIILQMITYGVLAPSSLFFFIVAAQIAFAALLHPKEFSRLSCVLIYYIAIPSMFMLLIIYSVFNMNNISWGTREDTNMSTNAPQASSETKDRKKTGALRFFRRGKNEGSAGCFSCSMKCMCCSQKHAGEENQAPPTNNNRNETETEVVSTSSSLRASGTTSSSSIQEPSISPWTCDPILSKAEEDKLPDEEFNFFKQLIMKYLKPIENSDDDKKRIEDDLKKLRDKIALGFCMINAIFIIVLFLLTLSRDQIHIKWPFGVSVNFTFVESVQEIVIYREYLQLEPIGIVFLVGFALLLLLQFIAMLKHRFRTFTQLLSNTTINLCGSGKISNGGLVPVINYYQKDGMRKHVKGKYNAEDAPGRRKTVFIMSSHFNASHEKFFDYQSAFKHRLETIKAEGKEGFDGCPYPWKTVKKLIDNLDNLNKTPIVSNGQVSNDDSNV